MVDSLEPYEVILENVWWYLSLHDSDTSGPIITIIMNMLAARQREARKKWKGKKEERRGWKRKLTTVHANRLGLASFNPAHGKFLLHNITLTSDLPTRDHVTGHVISDLLGFYCSFGLFGICMLEYNSAGYLCSNGSSRLGVLIPLAFASDLWLLEHITGPPI